MSGDRFDIMFFEEHCRKSMCSFDLNDNTVLMKEFDCYYQVQTEPSGTDMVCELKKYYPDTLTLMEKGNYLKLGGTKIGKWMKFDPDGVATECVDYERYCKIGWDKMLPILEKNRLDLHSIVNIARISSKSDGTYFPVESWIRDGSIDEDPPSVFWVVSVLVSARAVVEVTFDASLGVKLWCDYSEFR